MIILKFKLKSLLSMLFMTVILSGCSSNPDKDKIPENLSESKIYLLAEKLLDKNDFPDAIKHLRTLEARYPFGAFADYAQLNIIYAYYMNDEPEASIAAADRFIRLQPQNKNADYAFYIKGLASNTASISFIERYLPIDMDRRDPGQAIQSFNEFSELLSLYPNSKYAPDARQRMIALRNRLASYEIHAANYYLKRKAFVSAITRGQYVIENMQKTPSVPDALAILIEGYEHLGLTVPANEALTTLTLNYPDHTSLDNNGNFVGYKVFHDVDPSILSTLTFGLLGSSDHSIKKKHEVPQEKNPMIPPKSPE